MFLFCSYSSSMCTFPSQHRSVGSQVVYSSVEVDGDFEGHFRACRPIKKGEVLGVSYMNLGQVVKDSGSFRGVLPTGIYSGN